MPLAGQFCLQCRNKRLPKLDHQFVLAPSGFAADALLEADLEALQYS
jgi:hypothetical protein